MGFLPCQKTLPDWISPRAKKQQQKTTWNTLFWEQNGCHNLYSIAHHCPEDQSHQSHWVTFCHCTGWCWLKVKVGTSSSQQISYLMVAPPSVQRLPPGPQCDVENLWTSVFWRREVGCLSLVMGDMINSDKFSPTTGLDNGWLYTQRCSFIHYRIRSQTNPI